MMHGDTIQDTRGFFFKSWNKYKQSQALEPLESQLIAVILQHPEYHTFLDKQDPELHFHPDLGVTNPFLHMGLHLTLRDQIAMDRPVGIAAVFQQLLKKLGNEHDVEHLLLEPLAECLWSAQRQHQLPDERAYLKACQVLLE
ncbi:MAG: hypothetical protein CK424_00030 [Legionella sp.]|nr:MAG: hypothetical protein CK424_00030 [Legionella sp.]